MRNWKYLLIALVSILLACCGAWPAAAGTVQINEANNNQAISLNQGQPLELSLQSNPATGFAWSFTAAPCASVLKQMSHGYTPSSSALVPNPVGPVGPFFLAVPAGKVQRPPVRVIGAGGTEHWVFQAVGPGSAVISLKYSRPWENGAPAKTFTIKVNVGGGASGSGAPGAGK
jgi:predicted secreted protein